MSQSIKQWAGVDSLMRRPDGTKMTHEELFGKVVTAIGLDRVAQHIPQREKVHQLLKNGDKHLNGIPLRYWDINTGFIPGYLRGLGITTSSLSDRVCILKEAARLWAEREEENARTQET